MYDAANHTVSLHNVIESLTTETARETDASPSRVISDPAWLVRGNPDHQEHDVLGLRNPRGIQTPELVLIGSEQVYGVGVGPFHSWPALMQESMGGGVVNAGMPGWGSIQYALATEELSRLSPRRVMVCLSPSTDLLRAFTAARISSSPLARSFYEPRWAALNHSAPEAPARAQLAIDALTQADPGLADDDVLSLLAQRGEPDIDPCVIEASRFYLSEHSLLAQQDLDDPAVEAGLSITVKVLAHLRDMSEDRNFSLTVMLMPTREYLVYQRMNEAQLRDRLLLERLGLAEATVLGELRAACAGMGIRCFDLTNYLKHFVGSRIHAQNTRQGGLSGKGCALVARFVRERMLPGATIREPLRAAVGGAYFMY